MDWKITIPDGARFIRVDLIGDYKITAYSRMLSELNTWLGEHPSCPVLFDDRTLNVTLITPDEMAKSSDIFVWSDLSISGKRIAILVENEVEYDRTIQWCRMADGASITTMEVFRDEAEAIQWLYSKGSHHGGF